jgi:GNAT superfamily N-acetyltransferase
MRVAVTVTHLEMSSPTQLRPKTAPGPDVSVSRVPIPMPELNRFFYSAVGGDWLWVDRLRWTYDQWRTYLNRPELETWVVNVAGTPAGYFELERQPGGDVEIVYFGLLPAYTGSGLGGWALSEAARRAWSMGARRVWVHTCNLDHPGALANYLARGFEVFKVETTEEELPDQTPGPWPGAFRPDLKPA